MSTGIDNYFSSRYSGPMKTQNRFKTFYDSLSKEEREALATKAGTSVAYLWQLADGRRKAGMSASVRLKAADYRITDAMLRPDLYGGSK